METLELEGLIDKLGINCESDKTRFRKMYFSVYRPTGGDNFIPTSLSSAAEEQADPVFTSFCTVFRRHISRNPFVYLCNDRVRKAVAEAEVEHCKRSSVPLAEELGKELKWMFQVNHEKRAAFIQYNLDGALDDFRGQLSSKYPLEDVGKSYEESELEGFCSELMAKIEDDFSLSFYFVESSSAMSEHQDALLKAMSSIVTEAQEKNKLNAQQQLSIKLMNQAETRYKSEMMDYLNKNPFVKKENLDDVHEQTKSKCEKEDPTFAKLLVDAPAMTEAWDFKIKEQFQKLVETTWMTQGDKLIQALREDLKARGREMVKQRFNLKLEGKEELEGIFTQDFVPVMRRLLETAKKERPALVEAGETPTPGGVSERGGSGDGESAKKKAGSDDNIGAEETPVHLTLATIYALYSTTSYPYFNCELLVPKGTTLPTAPESRDISVAKSSVVSIQFLEVEDSASDPFVRDHRLRGSGKVVVGERNPEYEDARLTYYIDSSGVFRSSMVLRTCGTVTTFEQQVLKGLLSPGRRADDKPRKGCLLTSSSPKKTKKRQMTKKS